MDRATSKQQLLAQAVAEVDFYKPESFLQKREDTTPPTATRLERPVSAVARSIAPYDRQRHYAPESRSKSPYND